MFINDALKVISWLNAKMSRMNWLVFAIGLGILVPGIMITIMANQSIASAGAYTTNIPSPGYENMFLSFPEIGRVGAILGAVGSLLALVSFGLGRRKKRPAGGGMATYRSDEPS